MKKLKIHMSGIGGIGMSALARYYISTGNYVSGSDSSYSDIVKELELIVVRIIDENREFDPTCNLHVYTEAVDYDDVQRALARDNNIKTISYFQALGEISRDYKTIGICGTHGKSTTTSMIGSTMKKLNLNPFVIVGTKVKDFNNSNIYFNYDDKDKCFIVEACEYRGNFSSLDMDILVFLNCDHDHIDYFETEEDYIYTYKILISRMKKGSCIIANCDDENINNIITNIKDNNVNKYNFIEVKNLDNNNIGNHPIKSHNSKNEIMAYETLKVIIKKYYQDENCTDSSIIKNLKDFSGIWRRFDVLYNNDNKGITVIDDYAHHPSEIKATLSYLSLSRYFNKNREVIIIFQPHLHSRTIGFMDDFVDSFSENNFYTKLFIIKTYEARKESYESNAENSSVILYKKIKERLENKKLIQSDDKSNISTNKYLGGNYNNKSVQFFNSYNEALDLIKKENKESDIANYTLLTMGAGPINLLANEIVQIFNTKNIN